MPGLQRRCFPDGEDSVELLPQPVQNVLLLVSGEGGVTGTKLLQRSPFQKLLRIPLSTSCLSNAAVIHPSKGRAYEEIGKITEICRSPVAL